MSVKRYDLVGDMDGNCNLNEARMELSDDGVYVKYSEHSLLEQKLTDMAVQLANSESKCRELAVENVGLKNFIIKDCHVAHIEPETFYEEEVTRYVSADGYEPETPATEAFLAEVRAQGVEAFVMDFTEPAVMNNGTFYNEDLVEASNEFASQLRKGAAL